MAKVFKIYSSETMREFDNFLGLHQISVEMVEEPENTQIFFYFRIPARRVTSRLRRERIGKIVYLVPQYEETELQLKWCCDLFDFRPMSSEDIANYLRSFLTEGFHLNEEQFEIDGCKFVH